MSLSAGNKGKIKNETLNGVCGEVKLKLGIVEPFLSKRCAAAFKYLFAYLFRYELVSSMRISCKACHKTELDYSCKKSSRDTRSRVFYTLMNTVSKTSKTYLATL